LRVIFDERLDGAAIGRSPPAHPPRAAATAGIVVLVRAINWGTTAGLRRSASERPS